MDKDTLLKSLSGTLDANYATRKQSEEQLRYFEKILGFTNYLLELITDPTVNFGVQVSAAIFFKNRVHNYWNVPELRQATDRYIKPEEKAAIKGNLVEVLSKTYKNPQLRKQLSTALSSILDHDKWDELVDMIPKLINDVSNVDHVYTGLICLYEYTKNYRYAGIDNANSKNIVLEGVADSLFPILEDLASKLMSSPSEVSDEMIYLITKIFKFTTYSTLPTYLQQQGNLGTWCHLHLSIINLPLPESVLKADSQEERALNPRVKAVKWCFANMHRLLLRHGGGLNTKDKNGPFAKMFMSTFVPEILNAYWTIIEGWSTKQIWLSEASLYHLISFLEQIVETPSYPLIEEKLEAIIKHVLLPTLNATQETIELYEDEPDEYIRRFFDTSRDNSTADTASINFLFRLSSTKFSSCGTVLLSIINDIFQRRAADRASLQLAIETEGALRVLATISYKLDKKNSPVKGQMDQLLYTVVYPELSQEVIAKTPWLAARACDTIAMLVHKFSDDAILQNIFHGVVFCFQQQDHFPIQLTAIDALRTLVEEDTVAAQVAEQAPQLMGTLLDMSKNFESDILTTVMDVFVEKFAVNLEPYANELSVRLVEQFMKLANEILEQTSQNGTPDIDKEYQAAGIINTLTSLVIAMNASPQVSENLEVLLKDMIKFVLENSMALFLTEVLEMLESIVFSTNKMSPIMWELFQTCVECFDTFAQDYFDTFQPFFEAIIQCSFANDDITVEDPRVQSMFKICFQTLSGDVVDPVFAHQAFELIEFSILSLNKKFTPFLPQFLPEIFNIFSSLEAQDAFDGYMLHHLSILKIFFACLYVDAGSTLQFLSDKQFTNTFFKLWVKYSGDFQSVYGCKLQILASTAIACDAPLNLLPLEDIVGETVDLLISNMEVLPHAIKARQEIIDKENGAKASSKDYNADGEEDDEFGEDYYDDDFEADEAELEALKQTPIDPINVYYVFTERVSLLQHQDSSRYEAIFGSLDESQKEIANRIINIVHQLR